MYYLVSSFFLQNIYTSQRQKQGISKARIFPFIKKRKKEFTGQQLNCLLRGGKRGERPPNPILVTSGHKKL